VRFVFKNTILFLLLLFIGSLLAISFFLGAKRASYLKTTYSNEVELEKAKSIYSMPFLKRMGSVSFPDKRIHHFLNYSQKPKKDGVMRVGLFGDSHTYSSEVDMRNSLAVFLSEKLNQSGKVPYEVLNFGLGGGSFHQSLFLFEKYHQDLELDIIIFGPRGYQPERELSFHPFLNPFVPKNRFILSGNDVREVNHPAMRNYQNRHQELLSFFPSADYWKYERGLPLLYKVAFPSLEENPFYYSGNSADEESVEINSRLLEKIKERNPQKKFFATFNKKRRFKKYKKRLEDGPLANDVYFFSPRKKRLPYQRTDHASPYELEIMSDAFASLILEKTLIKRPVITLNSQRYTSNEAFSLKAASFVSAGNPLGVLRRNGYRDAVKKWPEEGVFFFRKGEFWGDGVLYPFSVDLIQSNNLSLEIDHKNYRIGSLIKLTSNIFLAELEMSEIDFVQSSLKGICLYPSEFKFLSKKTEIALNLGGALFKAKIKRGECLEVSINDFPIDETFVFKGPSYLENKPRDLLFSLSNSLIFLNNDLGESLPIGVVKLENP